MSLIQVIDVGQEYSSHFVFRGINCTIEHNSRIGLIGSNGCGKSTLIKIMLGILQPSEGKVVRAKKCQISYLAQNLSLDQNLPMLDFVKASRPDYQMQERQIHEISEALRIRHDPAKEEILNRLLDDYHSIGAYDFDNQVKYVLESLKFPPETWHRRLGSFSGGEQTRICLAAMLLAPMDLLILDEPTNHLDIAMIGWLENWLTKLSTPYLIVSHDRHFLDKTVSSIYCLRDGSLSVTKGNYSSFKEADEIARLAREKAARLQEKWINETEDFIARNIAGQKTNQAKGRLKQLQKVERISAPAGSTKLKLRLATESRSGNDIYRIQDMSFAAGGKLLAEKIDLYAGYQDRIAVIGPNGCGKTTLLKLLLGDATPQSGELKRGASLNIGYYDQHQITLDDRLTVKETIWQLAPLEPIGYVLSWLARFGFRGDDVDKSVSVLSGGERSRLYLSVLIHKRPNLLILDEPTNHLDIELTDSLLEALQDYDGTVIFVSHDRFFIEELATRYWVFRQRMTEDQSTIYSTIEDIDEDLERIIEVSFTPPQIVKEKVDNRVRKKKLNPWYLEQLHQQIEDKQQNIKAANDSLEEIHLRLADSATYEDANLLTALHQQMKELQVAIDQDRNSLEELELKYLELSYEE